MARRTISGFILGGAVFAVAAAGVAFVAGPPADRAAAPDPLAQGAAPSDAATDDRAVADDDAASGESGQDDAASDGPAGALPDSMGPESTGERAPGDAEQPDGAPPADAADGTGRAPDPARDEDAPDTRSDAAAAADTGGGAAADAAPESAGALAAGRDPAGAGAPDAVSRFDRAREDRSAELPGLDALPLRPGEAPRTASPAPDAPAALGEAAQRGPAAPAAGALSDTAMPAPPAPVTGTGIEAPAAARDSRPEGRASRAAAPAPDVAAALSEMARRAGTPPETPPATADMPSPAAPGPEGEAQERLTMLAPLGDADRAPLASAADPDGSDRAAPARTATERPEGEAAPARPATPERPEAKTAPGAIARPDAQTGPDTPRAEAAPERSRATPAPAAPDADPGPEASEPPARETERETARAAAPGRAPDLSELAPEIRTDRLPRVEAGIAPDGDAAVGAPPPPIRRYAAESDLPADAPRLAVVLVDEGALPFGADALASFPFPVSVAIDPSGEEARATMQTYRSSGVEVLAAADLPDGAAPRDAETASGIWFATLPETVAVLEARPGALQQDRALAEQVAGILADEGRGLVLHSRGLDTGLALAERAGVPAATLFRRIEDASDPAAIRRVLDRAALHARSEGAAIVVAPLRADVLPVLVNWGLASRDAGLALAPASAVLLAEE